MCGIVAMMGENTHQNRDAFCQLLLQASYRGTHATGLAWLDGGELRYYTAPCSAGVLLQEMDLPAALAGLPELRIVGHCRYATSGLTHLPIVHPDCALVLNGVISQAPPHRWPGAAVKAYDTDNDAEILLRAALAEDRGRVKGSFAAVELWADGCMRVYRNGERPLHIVENPTNIVVTSTRDMARRAAGLDATASLVFPGLVHAITDRSRPVISSPLQPVYDDLQRPSPL